MLVFLDLLEDGVRRMAGLSGVVRAAGVAGGRFPQHAGNHHQAGDDLGDAQGAG